MSIYIYVFIHKYIYTSIGSIAIDYKSFDTVGKKHLIKRTKHVQNKLRVIKFCIIYVEIKNIFCCWTSTPSPPDPRESALSRSIKLIFRHPRTDIYFLYSLRMIAVTTCYKFTAVANTSLSLHVIHSFMCSYTCLTCLYT